MEDTVPEEILPKVNIEQSLTLTFKTTKRYIIQHSNWFMPCSLETEGVHSTKNMINMNSVLYSQLLSFCTKS